jgi:ABC-2 type transport system permease protein
MRLLTVGGLLAYRALFNWTTPAMFIGTLLVGPLLQLLFFAYLGRELGVANDGFYVIGNAVLAASALCLYGGTMAISNERRFGTLSHVLLSPRSRITVFFGRALPYAANGLLVAAFTLGSGQVLLGLDLPAEVWPGLVLTLAVASMSAACFGLVLGAVGLRIRDVWLVSDCAIAVLMLLSGAIVPRNTLSIGMRSVGDILPLTHAVSAANSLARRGALGSVLPQLTIEFCIALGYAVLAILLLTLFERESRRTGSLDAT